MGPLQLGKVAAQMIVSLLSLPLSPSLSLSLSLSLSHTHTHTHTHTVPLSSPGASLDLMGPRLSTAHA